MSRYPDYKDTFPRWPARNLAELVPTLEPAGIDVLSLMLRYGTMLLLPTDKHVCILVPDQSVPTADMIRKDE